MLLLARRHQLEAAIVPIANHGEAALVPDIPVHPVETLHDALALVRGDTLPAAPPWRRPASDEPKAEEDLVDVRGQLLARRALEIAAAGGHNLLYSGPPGAGKTMLARRLAGLLPPLSSEEAVEVAAVHSAAGLSAEHVLVRRPFRAPHHTASDVALVGGGGRPRPGEVSLAHQGVLFLDELPEFRRSTLEVLRQPLEDGHVTLARHRGNVRLPARFQLVAAMNPCPCGRAGSALACRCTPAMVRRYLARLSGPLLDRIDLHAAVPPVTFDEIAGPASDGTSVVRERVLAARAAQARRAATTGATCNARIPGGALRLVSAPDRTGEQLLREAVAGAGLTARGLDRLLRVARTIADLAGRTAVGEQDVAEALQFRACVSDTAGRYSLQGFGEYS
jgi:magnesium chelatase family protein